MKSSPIKISPFLTIALAAMIGCAGCVNVSSTKTSQGAKASAPTTGSAPETKPPEAPATHTVARGSLKPKAQVDAVAQSTEMQAIKMEPKAWMDMTVVEAVPHGKRVKKGETLVKLDTDKLKEQITDIEADQPGSVIALEQAEAELDNLTKTTPLRLEAARRSAKIVQDDLEYFTKVGREQREKSARYSLTNSQEQLAYAMEELKQLEKMYKNDDLVEETEEIILRRQKHTVDANKFSLEQNQLSTERSLKTLIPRDAENQIQQKRDQDLSLALTEVTVPKALDKKRLDVEKMKRDQTKASRRLTDLKNDLKNLTVTSPMDGLVYYGACENGRWPTAPVIAKKLMPGAKLMPIEIIMTVVNPDKIVLKAFVPEADLSKFKVAMKGQASPVAFPDKKFQVTLVDLAATPSVAGGFECTLTFEGEKPANLMPGMSAKVTLSESKSQDALLVPSDVIVTEADKKFVHIAKQDGKFEKRQIKTGESENKMTEIIEGLKEGDKVLIKPPQAK